MQLNMSERKEKHGRAKFEREDHKSKNIGKLTKELIKYV